MAYSWESQQLNSGGAEHHPLKLQGLWPFSTYFFAAEVVNKEPPAVWELKTPKIPQ